MGIISILRLLPIVFLLLSVATAKEPATFGRSVDDMVGAFSIEKTVKLGDRGFFFGSEDADPLASPPSLDKISAEIGDDLAPSLSGFEIDPVAVDAASGEKVGITAHVLDDQAGLGSASTIRFVSPSGSQSADLTLAHLVSGTSKDGIYSESIALDQDSEKGTWALESLTLVDGAGNSRVLTGDDLAEMNLPHQFTVA